MRKYLSARSMCCSFFSCAKNCATLGLDSTEGRQFLAVGPQPFASLEGFHGEGGGCLFTTFPPLSIPRRRFCAGHA
ncbi:hypothetical protein [Treponema paraluiscuniculi]|uniref:hypothetical protein n=1 Tax=Treponema paraluiscuniculi TaxID=53435 RepID=UPI000A071B39|nr:hypothetical protein [Treponema paraluiscuniculi]